MLMHRYHGRVPLIHMDLYRLSSLEEAEAVGLAEVFTDDAVTAVEWADRFPTLLPSDRLELRLSHRTFTSRSIQFMAQGTRSRSLLARIRKALPSMQKQGQPPRPGPSEKRKASIR